MQKSGSSSSLGPGGLDPTQAFFRQIQRAAPPSPTKRHTKISVVGAGNVGMAIAQTILTQDVADELVLIDAKADKLRGELLDLQHAAAFLPRTKIHASVDYELTFGSDLCVVTAGACQVPGESRLNLLQRNVALFRSIIPPLARYSPETILLIVSINAVDVLTYVAWMLSGFPSNQVIGSGTNLDSSSFRFLIADHLDVNAQDVQLEPSQTVIDPNFENQIVGDLRKLESMEAIEELCQLSESMRQASALLANEDIYETSSSSGSSSRRASTFLNCVALGNFGAGKSAVLNSIIGHPVLPTGENGATRVPISIDLQRDGSLSSKSIVLQIDNKSQQVSASALRHSLQDRLSKSSSGKSRDEIYLNLRTSTAPPLKLIDLPGLDQRIMDESMVSEYTEHNDAILLVIVPAAQAPEIASSRALRVAKEFDGDGTRTIGVISKIDQAASDQKALAAVQALLLNQGPSRASDMPWVALIGQSVAIASASGSVGSESSLETAWRAESESLKSLLTGAPQSKLGRIALVDALAQQIRNRMKVRLPIILSGLQGKSQLVQDELVRLGEQMLNSSEGTRALALQLCREFEDKFLQHVTSGEGAGWKIVTSFGGNFPNRIKQLPLDRHFEINNVKRIVSEADGYQPYLISPEKGGRGGETSVQPPPSQTVIDLDSPRETSVQPPPSQTIIDPESLGGSLVQPPPSQPFVDREPPPNPINWAVGWQSTILTLSSTTASGIAIQSMEKEFQFPPSFHWLSLANSLTFSALFIAKVVGRKSPAAVKVLEQFAVFLAVTIFFLAVAIPLPLHFKYAVWAMYAVTMIIVFICEIL